MGAPHTQAFIQAKLDFFAAQMETVTASQEYSYDQGPVGEFALKKGKLEDVQKAYDFWLNMMEKYYPDAFSVQPKIEFNEIGYVNG